MTNQTWTENAAILASADPGLLQIVHAAAATCGTPLKTISQANDLAGRWREAAAVLVGADLAPAVAELGLPTRPGVFVVGSADTKAELIQWSMPLSAAVVALPEGRQWLGQILAGKAGLAAAGQLIAVVGGAGGLGASTLAASLALTGRSWGPASLVDVDWLGGGIDLLVGAEAQPGWRWDTLRTASGTITGLGDHLPLVDGVAVVAASRSDRRSVAAEALLAVLDSLANQGTVLVDVGRADDASRQTVIQAANRIVLLAGQSVHAVAAASGVAAELADRRLDVVVRLERQASVPPAAVAEALGSPLLGTLPPTPALALLADRGLPPTAAGRRWNSVCHKLTEGLLGPLPAKPRSAPGRLKDETSPLALRLDRSRLASPRLAPAGRRL